MEHVFAHIAVEIIAEVIQDAAWGPPQDTCARPEDIADYLSSTNSNPDSADDRK